MTENENPFAGAEIISDTGSDAAASADPVLLDPLGDPIEPARGGEFPPSPGPVPSFPPTTPWNGKPGRVPRIFVDPATGSIVEIAKKDQTFLRHVAELGPDGARNYARISDGRANHLLKLPAIQQYLRNVLDSAGITDSLLATRLREGLDAVTQKDHVMKVVEVIDGITVETQKLVAGPERIDFDQRRKNVELAFKLQGMEKAEPAAASGNAPIPTLGALAQLPPADLLLILEAIKLQQMKVEATDAEVVSPNGNTPPPSPAV